jgi:hypothetical protein
MMERVAATQQPAGSSAGTDAWRDNLSCAALLIEPRFGVALALVFHQTINLMPMTYAGGFSIAMCCRCAPISPILQAALSLLAPAAS